MKSLLPSTFNIGRSMFHVLVFLVSGFLLLTSPSARALIDFNQNGVSDLWEKQHNNGSLFPSSFNPALDHDGDGWTGTEEAAAGTNPNNGNSPDGFLVPAIDIIPATYGTQAEPGGEPILLTPETVTLAWPSIPGKHYTVFFSYDLENFTFVASRAGDASSTAIIHAIAITQPNGDIPPKLFFRVLTTDQDQDFDRLTDAEEHQLGSNPLSSYSDSDFLSDTLEVFNYLTDPADPDTDENGNFDHNELILIQQGTGGESIYASQLEWVGVDRRLNYSYLEQDQPPFTLLSASVFSQASWNAGLGQSETLTERLSLSTLRGRLHTEVSFPTQKLLPSGVWWQNSIQSSTSVFDHSEFSTIQEANFRILASKPSASEITKYLMVVNYDSDNNEEPIITSASFSIPSNKVTSSAKTFGTNYEPAHEASTRQEFRRSEFLPLEPQATGQENKGWDDTSGEVWRAVSMGETIDSYLSIVGPGLQQEVIDLIEIAVAPGSEDYISLSENTIDGSYVQFKIKGIKVRPVGDNSADAIQLRLRSDPSIIFAKMNVYVFNIREVPVSIFRIWDSRAPSSAFTGGLSDADIIDSLNEVYQNQGSIHFKLSPTSATVDLKRDPSKPFLADDEPLLFTTDGKFKIATSAHAEQITKQIHAVLFNARISIHVSKDFDETDILGFRLPPTRASFIKSSSGDLVYSHEVGHCIDLAYKAAGDQSAHDLGWWPHGWETEKKTGLMFPEYDNKMTQWLRREDWVIANQTGKNLR